MNIANQRGSSYHRYERKLHDDSSDLKPPARPGREGQEASSTTFSRSSTGTRGPLVAKLDQDEPFDGRSVAPPTRKVSCTQEQAPSPPQFTFINANNALCNDATLHHRSTQAQAPSPSKSTFINANDALCNDATLHHRNTFKDDNDGDGDDIRINQTLSAMEEEFSRDLDLVDTSSSRINQALPAMEEEFSHDADLVDTSSSRATDQATASASSMELLVSKLYAFHGPDGPPLRYTQQAPPYPAVSTSTGSQQGQHEQQQPPVRLLEPNDRSHSNSTTSDLSSGTGAWCWSAASNRSDFMRHDNDDNSENEEQGGQARARYPQVDSKEEYRTSHDHHLKPAARPSLDAGYKQAAAASRPSPEQYPEPFHSAKQRDNPEPFYSTKQRDNNNNSSNNKEEYRTSNDQHLKPAPHQPSDAGYKQAAAASRPPPEQYPEPLHSTKQRYTNNNNSNNNTTAPDNINIYSFTRDDASQADDSIQSDIPLPPALQQCLHYSIPGAFRMSTQGARLAIMDETSTVASSIRSIPPQPPRDPSDDYAIEARLVEMEDGLTLASTTNGAEDEDDENDYCLEELPSDEPMSTLLPPPPCAAAQYTVSMGGNTVTTFGTTRSPIVEAEPIDKHHALQAFFSNKKVQFILCVLVLVFLILAVGTSYGVTGFTGNFVNPTDPPNTYRATVAPTWDAPLEGDADLSYFVHIKLPKDTKVALENEDSAQSKALRWLRHNNTHLLSYSTEQRLQRFSLATFFYATGGEQKWRSRTGWLTDADECEWFTAADTTVCRNGMYHTLCLGANGLRGTIPPELEFLTALSLLQVPGNVLTGSIPSHVGMMTNLQKLLLWDNYLTGSIPSEIGRATNLETLDIEYNFFAQLLPTTIGQLTNLTDLIFDRNLLVGRLPSVLGQLTKLRNFHIFANNLSGTIPSQLGNMANLKHAYFDHNYFQGALPTQIGMWKNVVDWRIGNNTLTGSIPSELGNCQQLTYLDLFQNRLTGTLPSEVGLLTNAKYLFFEANSLYGTLPTELGDLESITNFWISSNQISGGLPSEMGRCQNLKQLDVSFNRLKGTLPSEIGLLTNAESLLLSKNEFSGRIPSELGNLRQLTKLELHDNAFTGTMPVEVCSLVTLGRIRLSDLTVDCSRVFCDCCNCFAGQDFNI